MKEKLRRILGFPFDPAYEEGYLRSMIKALYKPLLVIAVLVLFAVICMLAACVYAADYMGPAEFVPGLIAIHTVLLLCTFVTTMLAIAFRRQLFLNPKRYLHLVNSYAMIICLWSSVLAAYIYYEPVVYTTVIYVTLIVSLIAQIKPWQAIIMFGCNYACYAAAAVFFVPVALFEYVNLINALFATALSIVISAVMYRYRTSTYYTKMVITEKNEHINRINRRLMELVHSDELTGLYNRRYFDEVMPQKLEHILKTSDFACAMMMDVDHFKQYNDIYGHQKGDECLRQVVRLARERIPGDQAYFMRYGGEEFFLLTEASGLEDARRLAQSICSHVESAGLAHAGTMRGVVTISIGYAICDASEGYSLVEMARRADEALYYAKGNGRNCVYSYRGMLALLKGGKQKRLS